MKLRSVSILAAIVIAALFAIPSLHAQDVVPVVAPAVVSDPVVPVAITNALQGFIVSLAQNHAWLAGLIAFLGTMRLWAKPALSIVHSVVDLTPTKVDDGWFNGLLLFFNTNAVGKVLAYLLDWATSIKIQAPTGGTTK